MSDLVGKPEDRFSRDAAHFMDAMYFVSVASSYIFDLGF